MSSIKHLEAISPSGVVQSNIIKEAIQEIKYTEEYKFVETFGNENGNGNALYLLVQQWVEQKK